MAGNDVQRLAERVDVLMAEVAESAVPAVASRVEELVATLLQMYGAGLGRVVDLLAGVEGADRVATLRTLADDPLVAALLVLHDLHPDDVTTRVGRALDEVRPYLGSHAGGVELLGVDGEGRVHLRLQGSCDGCPSSSETVRNAIEEAVLAAAPDVVAVDVEGMVAAPALLQIPPFREHRPDGDDGGWSHVDLDVPPRTTGRALVAGEPVVVANLDGTLVAYRDECSACGGALSDGPLAGDVLGCPGCGEGYDVRLAGRAVGGGSRHLSPLPLLPEGTGWRLTIPTRVGA